MRIVFIIVANIGIILDFQNTISLKKKKYYICFITEVKQMVNYGKCTAISGILHNGMSGFSFLPI